MSKCEDDKHCPPPPYVTCDLCQARRDGCQNLINERFRGLRNVVIACSTTLGVVLSVVQLVSIYFHW